MEKIEFSSSGDSLLIWIWLDWVIKTTIITCSNFLWTKKQKVTKKSKVFFFCVIVYFIYSFFIILINFLIHIHFYYFFVLQTEDVRQWEKVSIFFFCNFLVLWQIFTQAIYCTIKAVKAIKHSVANYNSNLIKLKKTHQL